MLTAKSVLMVGLSWILALGPSSCREKAPSASARAQDAVNPPASVVQASAVASVRAAPSTSTGTPASLIFRGRLGVRDVLVRLMPDAKEPRRVRGWIIDVATANDTTLDGTFDPKAGSVSLSRTASTKQTERLAGTLTPEGIVEGALVPAVGKKSVFRWSPIVRGQSPVVVAKRVLRRKGGVPVECENVEDCAKDAGFCREDFLYPEIFGLGDAAREDALNAELRPEAVDCKVPSQDERSFKVALNERGVLSIELASSGYSEGAARPYAELDSLNVAVSTGKKLGASAVFRPNSEKELFELLLPQLKKAVAGESGSERTHALELLKNSVGPNFFTLETAGVRFRASLPHAWAALATDGFFLSYAELKPVLLEMSPASALWRSARAPHL